MTFRICDQTKMIIPSQGKKNQPQMKPFNGAVDGSKNISALKKKKYRCSDSNFQNAFKRSQLF